MARTGLQNKVRVSTQMTVTAINVTLYEVLSLDNELKGRPQVRE